MSLFIPFLMNLGSGLTVETLTTFAPNTLPLTGFYDTLIHEIIKENTQALYLSAIGTNLTANQTFSAGHKHNTLANRMTWRQLHNVLFHNNGASAIGSSPDQCVDALLISSTSTVQAAKGRLWVGTVDAAVVRPRVRVSNDNSATVTCTITVTYRPIASSAEATVTTSVITFTTATLRDRAWVIGPSVNLSAMTVDATYTGKIAASYEVSVALSASGEPVALHELSLGVT